MVVLLASILERGLPAFWQTYIRAEIFLDPAAIDPTNSRDPAVLSKTMTFAYTPLIKSSITGLAEELRAGPAPRSPRALAAMVSTARRPSCATTCSRTPKRSARPSNSSS